MWKFLKFEVFKPARLYSFLLTFLIIILEVVLLFIHRDISGGVPLWFSRPWGVTRLAEPQFLWLIPAASLIIALINNTLANLSNRYEPVLANVISFISIAAVMLGFISVYQILRVVSL